MDSRSPLRTSRRRVPAIAATFVVVLAIATYALATSAADSASTTASAARTTTSTAAGIRRAKWGSNVKITYGKTSIRWTSDGLPNHSRPAEYAVPTAAGNAIPTAATAKAAPDPTKAQTYSFTIPTKPKRAAKTTAAPQGTIGVMISGAVLFNPYEGDGTTVAAASNFTVKDSAGNDVAFLDSCNGHPNPMGQYHYHALPGCITSKVDTATGASHMIGLAFDGFPIYGDRDIKGHQLTKSKLDKCNGITSATPEFPKGIYHYVLLNTKDSTSSIRCFSGKVSASLTTMGGMGGMPPGH